MMTALRILNGFWRYPGNSTAKAILRGLRAKQKKLPTGFLNTQRKISLAGCILHAISPCAKKSLAGYADLMKRILITAKTPTSHSRQSHLARFLFARI